MDVLFDRNVDASILNFLTKVCEVVPPDFICTLGFTNGFRAYRQCEEVDAIALALSECNAESYSNKLYGEGARRWMKVVFEELSIVVDVVGRSGLAIDATRAEKVRTIGVVKDFSNSAYSNLFHFTVQCIIDFERFKRVWSVGQKVDAPDELVDLYDPDEGLIDVSGLRMTREAFVELKAGWTVIPTYKMLNYGLTKKFAGLFMRGIPSQWKV